MEGKSNGFEKAPLEYSGQISGPGVEFLDESIPVTVIQSRWTLMWKEKGTSELHFWVGTSYSPLSHRGLITCSRTFNEVISDPREQHTWGWCVWSWACEAPEKLG